MTYSYDRTASDNPNRIYYNGGGKYVVQVEPSLAGELQKAFPKSFRRQHGNSFFVTERATQLAKAWGAERGIQWGGNPMWDLKPGEMPSW